MAIEDEVVVGDFAWHSSRTPNSRCQVVVRAGRDGTRNVYVDALHADTGHIIKITYFRPHELPDVIAALQKADEILNG